jgi:hypothetical protein
MARLGIDAPTFVRLAQAAEGLHPSHRLVGTSGLRTQALQLLLDDVRGGRLEAPEALRLHERMTVTKVRLLGDRVSRRTAWDLAREHDWSDLAVAECLAVTRLQADALVTVDPLLAARAEGVVPVASFATLFDA